MAKPNLVISLGGSIIVPDGIAVDYLAQFKKLIEKHAGSYGKIYITCGGGKTCRDYIAAARQLARISDIDADWLGIQSASVNGMLLKLLFQDVINVEIVNAILKFDRGLKYCDDVGIGPGHSSDYTAVKLAEKYSCKTVLNLSNIKAVYDKDPKRYPDAKKLKKVTWPDYVKMIGEKWIPGGNFPFDPVASKLAQDQGIKVVVMDGHDLQNIAAFLNGEEFQGTTIG